MKAQRNNLTLCSFSSASWKYLPQLIVVVLVMSFFQTGLAIVSKNIVDIITGSSSQSLISWIAAAVFLNLSCDTATYLRTIIRVKAIEDIAKENRKKYLTKLLYTKYVIAEKFSLGDLLTRLSDDIQNISTFVPIQCSAILFGVIQILFGLIYGFSLSWKLTIASISIAPVSWIISQKITPTIQKMYASRQNEEGKVKGFFLNRLQNTTVIKSFSLTTWCLGQFKDIYKKRLDISLGYERQQAVLQSLSIGAGMLSSIGITCLGIWLISIGELTMGSLWGFLEILTTLYWPFYYFPSLLANIASQKASLNRIKELDALATDEKHEMHFETGEVVLTARSLAFDYIEDTRVFKNIDLDVQAGDILGIAGPSGSGKSTLLKVLLGLYDPSSGYIEAQIADKVYRNEQLRSMIAYVPQGNSLMSGTILENIRLGKNSASMDEVVEAAKRANAHDFIMSLPDRYNTVLGDLGSSLSDGQAQRIAIARAFLKDAPVIIMDEATSALDEASEEKVLQSIEDLSDRRLFILVAHRKAMLDICTKKLLLRNGQNNITLAA